MRGDNRYPAGTLRVKGADIEIQTDDDGIWHGRAAGRHITADTRDGLKRELAKAIRAAVATVSVPFLRRTDMHGRDPAVQSGVAYGRHANGNVLVEWADGTKDQLTSWSGSAMLSGDADPEEWLRLLAASHAAARDVHAYEEAHKIDLARQVRAALDTAVTDEGEAS